MRRLILACVVLFACSQPARAEEPDAKAIVAKGIKAAGIKDDGTPLFAAWKDEGVVTLGGMKIEYNAEFFFRAPDALRFDMNFELMGMKFKMASGTTKDKAWESLNGETRDVDAEKKDYVREMVYHFWVTTLTPLVRDKEFKLSSVVGKKVDDKPAHGVLVERKGRPVVTLYFDEKSGLLVKTEMNVKDEFQGWKEVLEETFYEDYKEVDGQKQFGKLRVVRGGATFLESKLTGLKYQEKIDAKLFDKP